MMMVRLVIVGIVILAAFGGVTLLSRLRTPASGAIPHGLTLVVAAGCHTCERAKTAFDAVGHRYRTMDIVDASALGVRSYTVPYAVVGDRTGRVAMVRRGPAVVTDARALAAASSAV